MWCESDPLACTAARARDLLDPGSVDAITAFVESRHTADGGFRGRAEGSDLYYTLFALECLSALGKPLPVERCGPYLARRGDGVGLDIVHLSCLLRCVRRLHGNHRHDGYRYRRLLDAHRASDGGYGLATSSDSGSVYASFMALLAYQASGLEVPNPDTIIDCVRSRRCSDGGYADGPDMEEGTTTVTAAAAILLAALGEQVDDEVVTWLMARQSPLGGFAASPRAPGPDLLSTATALFALATVGVSLRHLEASIFDYVEERWDVTGGFGAHHFDPTPDCEYTFYALLSLGAVAEAA